MRAQVVSDFLRQLWMEIRRNVTGRVIAACTSLFLALAVLDILHIVNWYQILSVLGLSYVGVVHRLLLFQFITAPLVHADLTHLAINMLTLWMLGPGVEQALGRHRYMVFSLLCACCSMMGFFLWSWGTATIVTGYSGVIFGLLVAQAIFFPNHVVYIYAFPLKMKHAVLVLGAVALYLTVSPDRSGIAHASHLFGALGAWVYLKATQSRRLKLEPRTAGLSRAPMTQLQSRKGRTEIPWEL
jgi:membrane associated rhomboid family serine protease